MNFKAKYLVIVLIITATSCSDFFHEEDAKYLTINILQEKKDIINGIYAQLVKVHDENYLKLLGRSDDLYYYRTFYKGSVGTKSISEISDAVYKNLYTAIITANKAIQQSNNTSGTYINGELYYLRAYCYYKLARLYGSPPLVIENNVNLSIEKPTYTEVYEFIESDLLKAIQLLPEKFTNEASIINDAAKALLAEVYLSWAGYPIKDEAKYIEAAKLSGEVIQNNNYALLENYNDLWKEKNNQNPENILSLTYAYNNANINASETLNNYYDIDVQNFDLGEYSKLYIQSNYLPDLKFYKNYPNNYRKKTTFRTGEFQLLYYETDNGEIIADYWFYLYDPFNERKPNFENIVPLKGIDQEYLIDFKILNFNGSTVPLYLLRYASTLLTYAEAKARIGELDASAFEAANQIRRRANNVDINSPSNFDLKFNLTAEQFIDSVIWERAWELCFEPDGRWFDIVRLDLKEKLAELILPQEFYFRNANMYWYQILDETLLIEIPDGCLSSNWYFYLIPEKDRRINANFKESN